MSPDHSLSEAVGYIGELMKMVAVPAAYYELVSVEKQKKTTEYLQTIGTIRSLGKSVAILFTLYLVGIIYIYLSVFMFFVIIMLDRMGGRILISSEVEDAVSIAIGLSILLYGLPFILGLFVPARAIEYVMIPYSWATAKLPNSAPAYLPSFSGIEFVEESEKWGRRLDFIPNFPFKGAIVFLYSSINWGYALIFVFLFNVLVFFLIGYSILSMLSFLLLVVIRFSAKCEKWFSNAKRAGLLFPLGAFIIYLFGTVIAFIGKTMAFWYDV
jgi:hypothetical protein